VAIRLKIKLQGLTGQSFDEGNKPFRRHPMRFDACPEGIPEFRLRGFYMAIIHNLLKSFLIIKYEADVLYGRPPNILLTI